MLTGRALASVLRTPCWKRCHMGTHGGGGGSIHAPRGQTAPHMVLTSPCDALSTAVSCPPSGSHARARASLTLTRWLLRGSRRDGHVNPSNVLLPTRAPACAWPGGRLLSAPLEDSRRQTRGPAGKARTRHTSLLPRDELQQTDRQTDTCPGNESGGRRKPVAAARFGSPGRTGGQMLLWAVGFRGTRSEAGLRGVEPSPPPGPGCLKGNVTPSL